MESDLLRKPVRVYNFPGYLDRVVRFDRVDQTRPKTARVKSKDTGASAEIDHHIAGLYRKRQGLAISAGANAIPDHRSKGVKAVKMHYLEQNCRPLRGEAALNSPGTRFCSRNVPSLAIQSGEVPKIRRLMTTLVTSCPNS